MIQIKGSLITNLVLYLNFLSYTYRYVHQPMPAWWLGQPSHSKSIHDERHEDWGILLGPHMAAENEGQEDYTHERMSIDRSKGASRNSNLSKPILVRAKPETTPGNRTDNQAHASRPEDDNDIIVVEDGRVSIANAALKDVLLAQYSEDESVIETMPLLKCICYLVWVDSQVGSDQCPEESREPRDVGNHTEFGFLPYASVY